MSRPKRLPKLSNSNRQLFLEQATRFHSELMDLNNGLRPSCEDYQSILKLHSELLDCIEATTGDQAPWTQIHAGWR